MNALTAAELKRRGMAAVEEALRRGPVHLVKRNKPSAVVLSEADYARLSQGRERAPVGLSAVQWLLRQPATGKRGKSTLDRALRAERESWK
jgi:prevent-host-death family protein